MVLFMLELKKGTVYHGFYLKEVTEIPDIKSTGYLFQHVKSNAQLYYVKNSDKNKVFFISFKTPPEDNCGTPHILEHSVLCGSKKYQAKDPFNELAKGSLNTYLNALTYADKTMYPVASMNQKDLLNMMDVYLDAVFYPRIYEKKEIFMQEGWHYHLKDAQKEIDISGVVYNEMKGALSDPESILGNCVSRSLFENSIYRFESGGDPDDIPNLSYESFLDFHSKYYHPSNSFLYLYGDMDIDTYLKYLDEAYLSHFDKREMIPEIELSVPMTEPVTMYDTYPVPAEQPTERETFLAYNVKVGLCTDPQLIMAFQLLNYILLETNASPLKKKLIASGLVADAEGWFDSSTLEMVYSMVGKKSEKESLHEFCNIIEDTLTDIMKRGLDKSLIYSALNRWEFYLRENDDGYRPKGLTYGMQLMKNWLHGKAPDSALMFWKHFNTIKDSVENNYFESLIESYILKNNNKSFVAVSPEAGKQRKADDLFSEKMKIKKQGLTEEEKECFIAETNALEQYQSEPETKEVLEQIPTLSLDEIDKEISEVECKEKMCGNQKVLFIPLDTNGILYTQLLFDLKGVPQRLLPYAGLLMRILGKLDTEEYSFDTLPIEIDFYTGGIGASNDIFPIDKYNYEAYASISGKALYKNKDKLFHIFDEMIFHTDFTKEENLKKIIRRIKILLENYMLNSSHAVASMHSCSNISYGSKIMEETRGITFFHFLSDIEKNLDEKISQVTAALRETSDYLFRKDNMIAAIACEAEVYEGVQQNVMSIHENLSSAPVEQQVYSFILASAQKAFTSSSKVQYNVKSGNFYDYGFEFSGKMHVLKTVIDLEYLWNRVRIKGGAYGCGCRFTKDGRIYFYSYRDPNIIDTMTAYNETEAFLENFQCDEKEMSRYILGTISSLDRPKSNGEKTDSAISNYFRGITSKTLQQFRNEVLAVKDSDLRTFAPLIHLMMGEENICTIGNENVIQNNMGLFETIQSLFN